jgi:hypothetical protein
MTVRAADALRAGRVYQLVLNRAGGITNCYGYSADADGDGDEGGTYTQFFAFGNRLRYYDDDGNRVQLTLNGGGTLQLLRGANWCAREIRIQGASDGSMLTGKVRYRRGSRGYTRIEQLIGIEGAGIQLPGDFIVQNVQS